MGAVPRQLSSKSVLSNRRKLGVLLGAVLGGLVIAPLHEALVVLGWLVGGLLGCLVGRVPGWHRESDELGLLNTFTILCLSVLVIGSEALLLDLLTPAGRFVLVAIAVATGIVSLVVLLAHDSLHLNCYNFLLLFGLFGLLTVTASPFVSVVLSDGEGLAGNETDAGPAVNGDRVRPDTGDDEPPGDDGGAAGLHWRVRIELSEGRTLRYDVSEWTLVPNTTVPLVQEPDSEWKGTHLNSNSSSRDFRITRRHDDSWRLEADRSDGTVSRWHLTAQNVSLLVGGDSNYLARELIVFGQGDIDTVSISRVDPAEQASASVVAEATERELSESSEVGETATPTTAPVDQETDTETVEPGLNDGAEPTRRDPGTGETAQPADLWYVPLLVGYGLIVIIGGLFRRRYSN